MFRFVVDGNWTHDGERASESNGMGDFNNVIDVSDHIEVERKFLVPDDYEEVLAGRGFTPEKKEVLLDEYYDNEVR